MTSTNTNKPSIQREKCTNVCTWWIMEVVHGIGSFHFMQTVEGPFHWTICHANIQLQIANALTCCWIIILFLLGGTKAVIFIIIIRLILSVAWVRAVVQLILLPVLGPSVLGSAVKRSIGSTTGCTITEKAPTRAFSWLKAATATFTFKTIKTLC